MLNPDRFQCKYYTRLFQTFHEPHDATARNRELKMRFQGLQHQKEFKLDTHWAVSPGDTLTLLVRRMKETLSQRLC